MFSKLVLLGPRDAAPRKLRKNTRNSRAAVTGVWQRAQALGGRPPLESASVTKLGLLDVCTPMERRAQRLERSSLSSELL